MYYEYDARVHERQKRKLRTEIDRYLYSSEYLVTTNTTICAELKSCKDSKCQSLLPESAVLFFSL